MNKVKLSTYDNSDFNHGKSRLFRFLWILASGIFIETMIPYPNSMKSCLLRLFGAKVGVGLVIKPGVKIKQPWCLEIENHCWLGEDVWIDNLVLVRLASNICLSQRAYLFTGNHNYKKTSFDLITAGIDLEDGVWIGANSIVGPGVRCHSHSILISGSAAFENLEAYSIYQGNPAVIKRRRIFCCHKNLAT